MSKTRRISDALDMVIRSKMRKRKGSYVDACDDLAESALGIPLEVATSKKKKRFVDQLLGF